MIAIHTERLIIRDHIESDLEALHKLISNKEVMNYLPEIMTETIEESKLNLHEAIEESKNDNRVKYYFAIINKKTDQFIGEIGFTKIKECTEGNILNLGYFIFKEYWGRGYAVEASKAIIDYAFKKINTVKVETGCLKENKQSEKVMIKIGLKKEADFRKHIIINDRLEYGITREDWLDMKNS
ncbi:Protein N-acetyltransferase, RimJ/RimL family [Evansella caseinilytica]|uniref:Protein N-acetyltransferase, RimJ/RimL family n=1 Tax=Evansella caseinilytica TaxID=1503961 RepID=A0A1H3NUN0_9BACI|nr:GNAT family protein [Evansella caseinilytica]SDY92582.1 Protein N-acetyltransferase, RimJ/RimL family [Evansella caseinilytica]